MYETPSVCSRIWQPCALRGEARETAAEGPHKKGLKSGEGVHVRGGEGAVGCVCASERRTAPRFAVGERKKRALASRSQRKEDEGSTRVSKHRRQLGKLQKEGENYCHKWERTSILMLNLGGENERKN